MSSSSLCPVFGQVLSFQHEFFHRARENVFPASTGIAQKEHGRSHPSEFLIGKMTGIGKNLSPDQFVF